MDRMQSFLSIADDELATICLDWNADLALFVERVSKTGLVSGHDFKACPEPAEGCLKGPEKTKGFSP
jgi:hypothetical protein